MRSDEWPARFSFWFSGCWRALAKGTAWAFFLCNSSSYIGTLGCRSARFFLSFRRPTTPKRGIPALVCSVATIADLDGAAETHVETRGTVGRFSILPLPQQANRHDERAEHRGREDARKERQLRSMQGRRRPRRRRPLHVTRHTPHAKSCTAPNGPNPTGCRCVCKIHRRRGSPRHRHMAKRSYDHTVVFRQDVSS